MKRGRWPLEELVSCIFIQPSLSGEKIHPSTPAWDIVIKGNLHSLWAASRKILPASDFLQLFLIQNNTHGTVVDLGWHIQIPFISFHLALYYRNNSLPYSPNALLSGNWTKSYSHLPLAYDVGFQEAHRNCLLLFQHRHSWWTAM